ncbi:monocarboxylate transporter 12-like [Ostrea edulis]|uniref:monocarboxylate transporter 12-like n=1 Tax=Ostrea edulis TaxID=37623 RepID=UPI002096016F|nr:monocarboxylate transporter 12-like [Ostrea edulis]XP_048764664.1 monocarboxylate transporter 12-like [Ostrea edulis]XP_056019686.1 monocarboxylate transporter 12-like [Ostrea edulis]
MLEQEQDKASRKRHESRSSVSNLSTSSEGTSSSSDSSISMPPAPDGGYGWVIVLSAFFVMVISDGFTLSFGVLFTELSKVFKESKGVTSIIAALFYGIPLVCGPISSAIVTKLGCRKAQIIGGLITSAGILASAFVDSIGLICFTFGFVAGFGLSIGYVNSLVIVAYYFEKKRSLATGLSVCGSGIGTFVFAPFLEFLIEEYGWRGSFIILSAVTLNLVVCGALMRPLEFTPMEEWRRNLERFENMSRTISRASLHDRSRHVSNSEELSSDSENEGSVRIEQLSHSQVQLPTFIKKSRNIPIEMLSDIRKNGSNFQHSVKQYFQSLDTDNTTANNASNLDTSPNNKLMVTSDDHIVFANEDGNVTDQVVKRRRKKKQSGQKKNPSPQTIMQYYPLYRKDLFYRRSLTRFTTTPQIRSRSCPELHMEMLEDSSDEEDDDSCPLPRLLRLSKHIKKMFKLMFDFQIMRNPTFLLFVFSNFILYFWYDIPYVFLNDIAKEEGIENPAFIISTLGIVNTLGQIIYGFIGDKNIDLTLLYGVSIILSGLAVMVVPWFMSFIPLCVIAGLFGLFISANYALSTVILVEIVGIDKLTNSYGLTMMMQGLANIIGPPVAGLLYDMSGSYDHTFVAGGIFIAFSGLLLIFVPIGKCLKSLITRKHSISSRTPKQREILMENGECQENLVSSNAETSV